MPRLNFDMGNVAKQGVEGNGSIDFGGGILFVWFFLKGIAHTNIYLSILSHPGYTVLSMGVSCCLQAGSFFCAKLLTCVNVFRALRPQVLEVNRDITVGFDWLSSGL